ncbi:MAG: hypothetical protein LBK04_04740 [Clostridiales Family XIII bacterium]|jgi:xylulokinase|nr:hypothetical protein [Clostridiales Family XIII bacterium]
MKDDYKAQPQAMTARQNTWQVVKFALGKIPSIESAQDLLPEYTTYTPNPANKAVHQRNYVVFKKLHDANKKSFALLNA